MARVVRSTAFQSNETYFIYLFFCVQSALRKTYCPESVAYTVTFW